MMSRRYLSLSIVTGIAVLSVIVVALLVYRTPPNNTVTLVLNAKVGDQPLIFNRFVYTNPGGTEKFRIRDFRFFVSNIKLYGKEGEYIENNSYHLARFDNGKKAFTIRLPSVGLSKLERVALSIGVDPKANTSIRSKRDLDPNSQMAWNWKVGYKFVLLEGGIRVNGQVRPLVYHVGFSENRRDLVFTSAKGIQLSNGKEVHFTVDAMKLFASTNKINIAKLQSVKFDKQDARLFADNYKNMIMANWE